MMPLPVMEAIFGLVGVLVGGGITWGIEWWREQHRRTGQARVAARLVASELMGQVAARILVDRLRLAFPDSEESKWRRRQPFQMWDEHRATLALTLPANGWQAVNNAYFRLSMPMPHDKDAWEAWLRDSMRALEPLVDKKELAGIPPEG